jgi:anti-sigma factor RsiW
MNEHLTTGTLIDFLHGELAAAEDARVHAHLAACSACRSAHELEAMLGETLRAAAAEEDREMPSLVSAAVWQRVREARPGPFARLAALLRPIVAVPLAAAILLGAFFASPLGHGSAPPKIDATYYLQAHAAQAGLTPLSEHSGTQLLETSMVDTSPNRSEGHAPGNAATGALDDVQ